MKLVLMHLTQTISYRNRTDSPIRIVVEPWAHQYLIDPSTEAEFRFFGEPAFAGRNEIEEAGTHLCLWPPDGGFVRLFVDGRELKQVGQE
ncbi:MULTISPECIES: hypothetical protein [unclassified Mesorhizobium]|uniref:hypothetical protein n=1 Tax=unclassified Mesorhizobium TaxID=325217 RepID=UPI000FCC98A1|nr:MULTISPECIES: hypothetical protein [unclassified Mesorhizobium]RUW68923.1 hypothetical protein EOA31_24590 [Mesorhizobium sp. M4B.F.Ca.ET.049.02.1.2]RVD20018.1 hypothetical protein EN738_24415 [Mesorhizobium sp. M4B.F.Ca.ET.017.02.2.1]RWC93659.1 MAG: hypothetical protein EOS32_20725 [Mesorhizobium sp.]TGV22413.1 hypothetical protein EN786_29525 [Mesorhizobium sp. M4B.F.Ca.ET.143.01.1.1]TIW71607.1 MAG: hypothetical protein E5V58_18625 [Mesorhizobium sp.]